MAGNKQMDRLARIIKSAEKGLRSGITTLQANIRALTAGGGLIPPKPKKDLIRALETLRSALNRAIIALEKSIAGKPKAGGRKKTRRKTAA